MTGDTAAPLLLEVLEDIDPTISHVTAIVELALHLEVSTTTDCGDCVNMIQIVILIEAGITSTGGQTQLFQLMNATGQPLPPWEGQQQGGGVCNDRGHMLEVLEDIDPTMSHVTAIVELALHLEVSTTTDCGDCVNMIQIVILIEAGITIGGEISVIQVTTQGKKSSLTVTTMTDRDPEIAITIARAIAIAVDSSKVSPMKKRRSFNGSLGNLSEVSPSTMEVKNWS